MSAINTRCTLPVKRCYHARYHLQFSRHMAMSDAPPSRMEVTRETMQATIETMQVELARLRRKAVFSGPRMLVVGGIFGACTLGGVVYWNVERQTALVELAVAAMARSSFRRSRTYEERKNVFMNVPEPILPFDTLEVEARERMLKAPGNFEGAHVLSMWGETVVHAFGALDAPGYIVSRSEMRRSLVQEISQSELPLSSRIAELKTLWPSSIERDQAIAALLAREEWLEAAVLEESRPHERQYACEVATTMLIKLLAFFPASFSQLVVILRGQCEPEDTFPGEIQNQDECELALAGLHEVRRHFNALDAVLQRRVLLAALTQAISALTRLNESSTGSVGISPYELYVRAVDSDLLGPLRREAKITEEVLQQVKCVYLALPPHIQARVLLTAMEHPHARGTTDSNGQAEIVRDLLAAGGVVAVKLAQMLAEDTRVPLAYRELFGSLRDDNEPMGANAVWHSIPPSIREHITHLGPCLGTGSVKQVHRARFEDGSEFAVAVLRGGVEDEALASLSALEVVPELAPVASRLKHLVYGEFNLFAEGEALGEFAATEIGCHPRFRVVGVKHNSPRCLIEEIAQGPTVAHVLKSVTTTSALSNQQRATLDTLVEFHRVVIAAFMKGGLIHSDIHLGNMIQEGNVRFALFDVGQFMRINPAETSALLWAMCWISTPLNHSILRSIALKHLTSVSSKRETSEPLHMLIDSAFNAAVAPFEDGSRPDGKTAWMLFLRNCEQTGVVLPQGAFALAKMMDSILSQQEAFSLSPVLQEMCTTFLRKYVTWGEMVSMAGAYALWRLGRDRLDSS